MSEKRRTGRLGGFELLAQEAADEAFRSVMMLRDRAFGDSPIECLFYAALVTGARHASRSITDLMPVTKEYPLDEAKYGIAAMGNPRFTAFIERQVQVAGWRVDFVVHYPDLDQPLDEVGYRPFKRLIVECDGHAYHERTKDQAARDRSRDRQAQLEGLPVFRFTGSELWNDPLGCADEVLAFMERG